MTDVTREAALRPWRIVIVDDSPDDREEIRRLLLLGSARRCTFVEAETGAAGVTAVLGTGAGPLDCVLLDYHLPDMEAPAVLSAIREPGGLTVCPVVVLTGSADPEKGRSVIRAGAQDHLGKDDLTPSSLARAIENAIERREVSRELRDRQRVLEASEAAYRSLLERAQESEARLRLALEASRTGIWTWDVRTDAVTWSREHYEICGLPEGTFEGTGTAFFRLVHPEDRARVEATVRAAIAARDPYRCEFRMVRPTGEVIWVENLARASYDGRGAPERVLGTITEITDRKRAADDLARSEERLRRAQRAARVGTWDWNVSTGEATWTDEAWRLFGHVPDTRPVDYRLWLESVHPVDRDSAAAAVRAAMTSGTYRHEFRVRHRDGTVRWVESAGEIVFGPDGRPCRMLGTAQDVTERHAAEEALRASERRLRELADSMPQLVWKARSDGTVEYQNARASEYTALAVTGEGALTWEPLVHPDDLERTLTAWRAAVDRLVPYSCEHRCRMADDSYRWHISRARPVRDPRGGVTWYGTSTDIQERKLVEESLQQAVTLGELFAGVLGHDLRNPLSAIVTAATLLSRGPDPERTAELAARIRSSADRMARMISQLLDFTRIRLGRGLPLERRPADLAELCRVVIGEISSVQRRDVRLVIDGDATGTWDHDRLAQLVSNLVANACQHGSPESPVHVEIDGRDPDVVCLEVRNSGTIPRHLLPELFQPFRNRQPADAQRTSAGLGLGLYITERIAVAHGGSIRGDSDPLGTRFAVELPRHGSVVKSSGVFGPAASPGDQLA